MRTGASATIARIRYELSLFDKTAMCYDDFIKVRIISAKSKRVVEFNQIAKAAIITHLSKLHNSICSRIHRCAHISGKIYARVQMLGKIQRVDSVAKICRYALVIIQRIAIWHEFHHKDFLRACERSHIYALTQILSDSILRVFDPYDTL